MFYTNIASSFLLFLYFSINENELPQNTCYRPQQQQTDL